MFDSGEETPPRLPTAGDDPPSASPPSVVRSPRLVAGAPLTANEQRLPLTQKRPAVKVPGSFKSVDIGH